MASGTPSKEPTLAPLLEEWDTDLRSGDPLDFPGYADKVASMGGESVRTGRADGFVLIEGDFGVIGGSMGLVHGEKVVRAFDRATVARLPVVVVTRSGGARMQEGMVSLIQMARTSAAAERHSGAGLLSVAVHRSPTTGGVFASYGSLTDLRVAEAGATVGFAGPRVVAGTTGEDVEGRSHTAETAGDARLVDLVLPIDELWPWVEAALGRLDRPLLAHRPPTPLRQTAQDGDAATDPAGSAVRAARQMGRPTGIHVAEAATRSWVELAPGTDPALRTALVTLASLASPAIVEDDGDGGDDDDGHDAGPRAVVIATDRYATGGGRPTPAGYRLAQRGIALADRLGLPVVSFVDMSGAEPGSDSENDGIAGEIARTFAAMARLRAPSVAVCVGEGGSGGALALAATDRLLIQENAIFSVIGPEGASAILERDAAKAPDVAPLLKLMSTDLVDLGIVDQVVPDDVDATVAAVGVALAEAQPGDRVRRFDTATHRWLRA